MSEIKVEEIVDYERGIQLGYARVVIDNKIRINIKLLKGRDEGFYCVMPSIRILESYEDSISLVDKDKERQLLKDIKAAVDEYSSFELVSQEELLKMEQCPSSTEEVELPF